jgi:hypothetical protein
MELEKFLREAEGASWSSGKSRRKDLADETFDKQGGR